MPLGMLCRIVARRNSSRAVMASCHSCLVPQLSR
ncbi:hypothetical protein RHECNPAF_1700038 [Rhizobium etli CNPAF512]|nr:hypothetical protein RHECNPAF_1700038 [Rhizobium etli CNPAF512]